MPYQTRFELLHFEQMLAADRNPNALGAVLENQTTESLTDAITLEASRIITEFKHVICKGYDEPHLERYIQLHEKGITTLMDLTYAFITAGVQPGLPVYEHLMAALTRIMDYIEKECCCYFNLNLPVPEHFRAASADALAKDTLVIRAKMKSKGIEQSLQELIVEYLDQHCAKTKCSYQQQKYARLFTENLLKLLGSNADLNWNRELQLTLLYLNFNRSSFFTYCRRFIATEVDELPDTAGQRQQFFWFVKELQKLSIKPNVAYHSGRPGLTELISAYIMAEIAYLDERPKVVPGQVVQTFTERADKFDFKLPLNLTVPQLALIAQLFIDVGVFIVEKGQIMTVMKFFAANVTTVGTDGISADNLNKQRKKGATQVCTAIEKILEDMLRLLRNGYMGG
jgi:hypothetical protein